MTDEQSRAAAIAAGVTPAFVAGEPYEHPVEGVEWHGPGNIRIEVGEPHTEWHAVQVRVVTPFGTVVHVVDVP